MQTLTSEYEKCDQVKAENQKFKKAAIGTENAKKFLVC